MIRLFVQAFSQVPLIPLQRFVPDLSPRAEKVLSEIGGELIKFPVNFYMVMKSCLAYGVRKGDELVCASLSVDSTEKPTLVIWVQLIPHLIMLIIRINLLFNRLARIVGRRTARELAKNLRDLKAAFKEKPRYEDKYLELGVLGTLPTYQGQGFGRKMLHFLYDKAKTEGYKGIILLTNRDYPAFRFYLKEEFTVDREFKLGEITLCWMRLVF